VRGTAADTAWPIQEGTARRTSAGPDTAALPSGSGCDQSTSPRQMRVRAHVRALLGDRITDVLTERRTPTVDHFADGAAFRRYFKSCYGPTISAYRNIDGDADRVAAPDIDIARLGGGSLHGGSTMAWEYPLVTARKG
jgi:hypothetical protein